MTCSWSEARFERLLDGDLPAGERVEVNAHLASCDGCRSLFDELRVVDGLLQRPRPVEPPDDFTRATMADVRAMPPPRPVRPPLRAYVVCYLVAAWSLIGAAAVLDPQLVRTAGTAMQRVAWTVAIACAGVFHVATHVGERGELFSWTTFAGAFLVADVALIAALFAAQRLIVPRAGGQRSS